MRQAVMRSIRWLLRRKIELLIFTLGVVLRVSMKYNYAAKYGYDAGLHKEVITWFTTTWTLPPIESMFEAFHPPLYYMSAAWLLRHGVKSANLAWFSIGCGILRLAIIWAGLELYVVRSRVARIVGLALAAVVAASVHLDGMVYPEAMSCLLNALVMLLVPLAFRRQGHDRWPLAITLGLILGVAMLTKVSALATIGAIGAAVAFEFLVVRQSLKIRFVQALPWVGMLLVCGVLSGWYYGRNVRDYGRPFVTSFDLDSQHWLVADAEKNGFLDRRTLGYFVGWQDGYYARPIAGPYVSTNPRFFPVAVASTFVDLWEYSYQGFLPRRKGEAQHIRPSSEVFPAARLAVAGGTVIFLATLVAWVWVLVRTVVNRNTQCFVLLMFPFLTMLAALQFSIASPVDGYGVVKGIYMTFGAPALYGLFGIAVAWGLQKPIRWPLAAVMLGALVLAANYSTVCRLRLPLIPLG